MQWLPTKSFFATVQLTGRAVFAASIIFLGIETLFCANSSAHPLGPGFNQIPVMPWLPAIPSLAYTFAVLMVLSGVGLFFRHWRTSAALFLSAFFTACTLVLIAPKYILKPADIGLRTVMFEPLTFAALALLISGEGKQKRVITQVGAFLFSASLFVFGLDHFLALRGIATLVPSWLPWHSCWIIFFGAILIALGLCVCLGYLTRWAMAANGLVFALWVITLHVPRVLGLYGVPGATRNPDEWSSLLIAVGIWGGSWAVPHGPANAVDSIPIDG